jgi:hypothetical protein
LIVKIKHIYSIECLNSIHIFKVTASSIATKEREGDFYKALIESHTLTVYVPFILVVVCELD